MSAYQYSRVFARNVHIIVALFQFFYIYGPLHTVPDAIKIVQYVTFPLLLITGIWLRKGGVIWNGMQKRKAKPGLEFQA